MTAYYPASLDEALDILSSGAVIPIAGGTDLMVRHRRHGPLAIKLNGDPMFVGALPELRGFSTEGNRLRIGAAVTLTEIGEHELVSAGLKTALREFASPAIRNAGTLAGNICNASPAADTLPYLYACDAVVELSSRSGSRQVPVADFITGPGATAKKPDELVTAVTVPVAADGYFFYRKVAPRKSNALSKLSIYAEAHKTAGGTLTGFRCSVGAVAPTVVRLPETETRVEGVAATGLPALAGEIAERFAASISPISDQRSTAVYRRNTAVKLVHYVIADDLPQYLESA